VKITESCFQRAAPRAEDEPKTPGPHVVFLGRSNVGKSSLINALLGTKGLARTSSRPGRTQCVHYYRINDAFHFIDLPGYGYAKVPEAIRRQWGPLVEGFLERHRERIGLAILIIDSRHGASKLDQVMQAWLEERGLHYLVVATKSDKLSGNGRTKAIKLLRETFSGSTGSEPILVSATTGRGIREIWRHLDQALLAVEQ